jgi:cytochrome c peroxidase
MGTTTTIRRTVLFAGLGITAFSAVALAAMSPAQQAVYDQYMAAAKKAGPAFSGFSAEKGRAFFYAKHTGGKPDSPSCTACHTENLKGTGKTRAGKDIQPMAVSANPKRFTDPADVEKWFSRNCPDVLGRECTVTEKGDVLTFLLSQ